MIEAPSKYQNQQEMEQTEYMTHFMQNDMLGQVSNTWLRLCEILGKDGPLYPDCLKLSAMH